MTDQKYADFKALSRDHDAALYGIAIAARRSLDSNNNQHLVDALAIFDEVSANFKAYAEGGK